MSEPQYQFIENESGVPIKAWTRGVVLDAKAEQQLRNLAKMPFIHGWIAAMPDVHWGIGATVGSVIASVGAIIPAAVGVDIGCGMMAVETSLTASDLPESMKAVRSVIESAVPHGRTQNGGPGDRGAWGKLPDANKVAWRELAPSLQTIQSKHPKLGKRRGNGPMHHLGTLGSGNHFVEVCLDESQRVWFLLHSGSRGIGNQIGTYFIELARKDMEAIFHTLPDKDLAYFNEGTEHFTDYVEAVGWAQAFAQTNRELMMKNIIQAVASVEGIPPFTLKSQAINCHHNYVAQEFHYGKEVWLTRKGAVRAGSGERGIIPGSMGAQSYIVEGLGNEESFQSCSHGAGRTLSRSEAKRQFTVKDHEKATEGVECRKDAGVLDETPGAYKSIEAVMAAQKDLVRVVHTLRQIVCIKG